MGGASDGQDVLVTIRLVTWNLQGRARPDLVEVASVLVDLEPDVVLLQEVQRAQARSLARRLGWFREWRFKHWPFVVAPEGLALLSPRPMTDVERTVLAMPWSFWSWRRRVAIAATVDGGRLRVVDTHLGAGVSDAERARQARITLEMARRGPSVVGGDLNTRPDSPVIRTYRDAGFADAWSTVSDELGATNWKPGPRTEPPIQRLDYMMVGGGVRVVSAMVPSPDDAVERFGPISDHVPLVVSLDVPG